MLVCLYICTCRCIFEWICGDVTSYVEVLWESAGNKSNLSRVNSLEFIIT